VLWALALAWISCREMLSIKKPVALLSCLSSYHIRSTFLASLHSIFLPYFRIYLSILTTNFNPISVQQHFLKIHTSTTIMSTYLTSDTSSTTSLVSPSRRNIKTGIGGAGNFRQASSTLPKSSTPRLIPSQSSGVFLTGIGGAGNCHSYGARPVITQEEEIARRRARKESAASSWHHGIGGAGNRRYSTAGGWEGDSRRSSEVSSGDGVVSGADRMRERVIGFFGGK
jgi:Protein of unknown function (DUF3602)